ADAACLPHSDLEKSLADALAAEDLEGYARGLLGADVVLPLETGKTGPRDVADPRFPWFRVTVPGDEYEGAILGYTSEDRMRDRPARAAGPRRAAGARGGRGRHRGGGPGGGRAGAGGAVPDQRAQPGRGADPPPAGHQDAAARRALPAARPARAGVAVRRRGQ